MTYNETLEYIFHKLPMFSRMGSAAYKNDLTNIRALCENLGHPHHRFPAIHIAGTNGKGSVSHMLASIFQTAGYKTGLYTSPHLYDFRERIRINGEMITKDFVVDFVEKMRNQIESLKPSFFEITVAMAFEAFATQHVDIGIIEVGLGGRLDSTNIITPLLSVITNIGKDHMTLLGNTMEEIAREKGGIIKEKVPVVIGETTPETGLVFTQLARQKKAPIYWAEKEVEVVSFQLQTISLEAIYNKPNGDVISITTDLPGIYQLQNIRTVLTAVDVLREQWSLSHESVKQGLKEVKKRTGLGGRWEVIRQQPTVVLDVAHNEDGIRKMLEHLHQLTYGTLHLVIGMVKDKDVDTILTLLPAQATYYFTQAQIPRALPVEELKEKAALHNLIGNGYPNVNEALQAARQLAGENDLVLVCGSIFLVAEVNKTQ